MVIDLQHFTPFHSVAGGILIGAAAGILIIFCGRIMGISGIIGGLLPASWSEQQWRIAFLAGVLLAPVVFSLFATLPEITVNTSWGRLMVAGLLVGVGTRLGSGCTSGHGVCGLSRLSLRSLVATLIFMATAMLVVGFMP